RQRGAGATIVGICGGFQMLGRSVADPAGVEGPLTSAQGLSLLPARTVITAHKRTEAVRAVLPNGVAFGAYAIHAGETTALDENIESFAVLADGSHDGMRCVGVIGTYLHGVLEHPAVCEHLFGVRPPADAKHASYDRLADWFETHARHV